MGTASALSPDYPDLLPPALIERKQSPFNVWRKIPQNGFGRGVDAKRRSDQVESRWQRRKLYATKIAVALKFIFVPGDPVSNLGLLGGTPVVVQNANPIVETLQR